MCCPPSVPVSRPDLGVPCVSASEADVGAMPHAQRGLPAGTEGPDGGWLHQAVELLHIALERLPRTPTLAAHLLRFNGGSELTRMIFDSEEREDPKRIATGLLPDLQNLPELWDLVAFVQQDDWLREGISINTPQQQVLEAGHAWWITSTIGLRLLTHYLEEAGTGDWDPEVLRRLFADFAVHLTKDTVPINITAPLFNLESPLDDLWFGDDLVIRRLTQEDNSRLKRRV